MHFILDKLVKFDILNIIGVYRMDNHEHYYVLKIKKNNSKLEIIEDSVFSSFQDLLSSLDARIPIILLIDGKGILNKKIDLKNDIDLEWKKNLDYTTIHFLSYTTSNFQFLSFCRQNILEDLIHSFQNNSFQVVDFYVGSLVSVLLNSTLKKSKLFSNDLVLDFENDDLVDIIKGNINEENKNYQIVEKMISKNHLPLYGASINFYVKHNSIEKSQSKSINIEELIYKSAFNKLGILMIVGFFSALLLSYGFIQYYNSKNAQLNLENVYSNQSFALVQKLEEQKNNKLKLVTDTGISSSKFISFYSYEITKSTLSEINLTVIDVFPLENEIKNSKKVEFKSNVIIISGYTHNEEVLNSWFEKIRGFSWIKNLEIVSIKKDKNNNSFFDLKIIIKNV